MSFYSFIILSHQIVSSSLTVCVCEEKGQKVMVTKMIESVTISESMLRYIDILSYSVSVSKLNEMNVLE
jgi:hypothetical protein